jgi:hypothetical protein
MDTYKEWPVRVAGIIDVPYIPNLLECLEDGVFDAKRSPERNNLSPYSFLLHCI